MRRLKNVSVFFLTLILSLSFISTPALAEFPWSESPPQLGKGTDDPPNPRGGPSSEVIPSNGVKTLSYSNLLFEISYRFAEFWTDDAKTLKMEQELLKKTKNTSEKVD